MKIFLSYASQDRPIADAINRALLDQGHDVFFDRDDLPPGEEFHIRIRRAIEQAELFVFLVSEEAIDPGSYTLNELEIAEKQVEAAIRAPAAGAAAAHGVRPAAGVREVRDAARIAGEHRGCGGRCRASHRREAAARAPDEGGWRRGRRRRDRRRCLDRPHDRRACPGDHGQGWRSRRARSGRQLHHGRRRGIAAPRALSRCVLHRSLRSHDRPLCEVPRRHRVRAPSGRMGGARPQSR